MLFRSETGGGRSGLVNFSKRHAGLANGAAQVKRIGAGTQCDEQGRVVSAGEVERADGVFLRDSTAMIEWFEARYTQVPVLPEDPAAAYLCRLLEDYADEGLWRPALYYRWAFDKDALLNAIVDALAKPMK